MAPGNSCTKRRLGAVLASLLTAVLVCRAAPSAAPLPPAPVCPGATPAIVDCRRTFLGIGDQGLRLDARGRAHAAYVGEAVYYARVDEAGSHVEVVADAPATIYEGTYRPLVALALDAHDVPHLAFLDPSHRAVLYAHRTDGSWRIETAATAASGKLITYR